MSYSLTTAAETRRTSRGRMGLRRLCTGTILQIPDPWVAISKAEPFALSVCRRQVGRRPGSAESLLRPICRSVEAIVNILEPLTRSLDVINGYHPHLATTRFTTNFSRELSTSNYFFRFCTKPSLGVFSRRSAAPQFVHMQPLPAELRAAFWFQVDAQLTGAGGPAVEPRRYGGATEFSYQQIL